MHFDVAALVENIIHSFIQYFLGIYHAPLGLNNEEEDRNCLVARRYFES